MPNHNGSTDSRLFSEFVNSQLDLSGLDVPSDPAPLEAPLKAPRLTDAEIEQVIMPLIRDDIRRETMRQVVQLMRDPQAGQDDYWRARLAPFHREIRDCLAPTIASLIEHRYPGRLSTDEWLDVATFAVTLAWLVRRHMDGSSDGDSEAAANDDLNLPLDR